MPNDMNRAQEIVLPAKPLSWTIWGKVGGANGRCTGTQGMSIGIIRQTGQSTGVDKTDVTPSCAPLRFALVSQLGVASNWANKKAKLKLNSFNFAVFW